MKQDIGSFEDFLKSAIESVCETKIQSFTIEMSLLEGGLLDSIAIADLLALIEDEFSIEIPDDQINDQNFATPSSIWSMIQKVKSL